MFTQNIRPFWKAYYLKPLAIDNLLSFTIWLIIK